MKPKGIPTVFNGIQFRSRAEARWAAFMDEIGWSYWYEPQDSLGYIPDFLVNDDFWLEVKPALTVGELRTEVKKVREAVKGDGRRAIIVGNLPILQGQDVFGVVAVSADDLALYEQVGDLPHVPPVACDFVSWALCPECDQTAWTEFGNSFAYACKGHEGGLSMELWHNDLTRLKEDWHRAGNLTQWQGQHTVMNDTVYQLLTRQITYEEAEANLIAQVQADLEEAFKRRGVTS